MACEKLAPRQDYYVYLLIDPRDGLPFYVGKGVGERYRSHFRKRRGCGGPFDLNLSLTLKEQRIDDIHRDGLEVQYAFVAVGLTESAAVRLERLTLRKYEGTLTNVSAGMISEAEIGLQGINRAIARIKPPTRWVREWFKEFGRMPTLDEMDGYTDLHLSHLRLRRQCRLALMEDDASPGQPTA